MSEVGRIVDHLQRIWDGEPFHGPAVSTLLAGVAARAAFARPLKGAHSIAEIARHIGTWEDVVRRRLGGEVIDGLPDDQDWPDASAASPEAWEAIRRELGDRHARLEGAVAALPESRLAEPVAARDYDVRYMLHGIVQHTLYHAGQIALLKKASEQAAG
jgi:uncharacterized damage-inducible protein DinB